ncbi:hypothetical protein IW261DRAFT_1558517 [Armillaria novae-zelandiae]|uniref:Uncharacterized protein n=1 Tax=Armillaria novae-zelandiae TaxID=153914 RepID=A0AA39PNH4_9AGAR|nr:hypothetical protein IW261DRAFT_1558517 [Armillaria novae-zelandiae]
MPKSPRFQLTPPRITTIHSVMKLKRVSIENASISISSSSSSLLRRRSLSPSSARRAVRSPLELSHHLAIFPPPPSAQGFPEGTFFYVCSPSPPALYTNLLLSDAPFRMDVPRITHARPGSYSSLNGLILSRRSCFDIFPPAIPTLALTEPEPKPEPRQHPPVIHIPAAEDDPECLLQYELAAALLSRGNTHRKRPEGAKTCEKKEYIKSHLSQELR